jgi:hypothetical protein
MNSNYSCEKCGKIFKQKSRYDLHMKKKKACVVEHGVEETKDEVNEVKTFKDLFEFLKGYDRPNIYEWLDEPWIGKDKQESLLRLFAYLGLIDKLNKYDMCGGNFNLRTIEKLMTIRDCFYTENNSLKKLKDKGDSSDLTGIHKENEKHLLATTSKNLNNLTVGRLDIDKILTNFRQYEEDGYTMTLCICVRDIEEYNRMKNEVEHTSRKLISFLEMEDTIVLDWKDLNQAYNMFKTYLGFIDFEQLVVRQKNIILMKMHQHFSVSKTMALKNCGKKRILWGHIQRSGKSYIIAGCIIEDGKNKDVCNYLVITTAPNETISQQVKVFDCVQLEDFNVVVLNGKNKKPTLTNKNIIICSKQFLQSKIEDKDEEKTNSIPWLKKINFDMRFVDESHNGGTTELAKKTLDFYGGSVFTVQITATYSKPVNDFGILKEDWILWDMEDIKLCKNILEEGKIDRLIEKHGNEFSNIIDEYSFSSIIEEYSKYPELNILADKLSDNVVSEIISKTKNNEYGWSTDACFLLKQGLKEDKIVLKKEFQNENEMLKLWYRIFGKYDEFGIPDEEFPDSSVFIKRIEMICKNAVVNSRFIGDADGPSIIMAFLPQNNINKISEATILLLKKYNVIPEYEIVSINSKVTNDPKQVIEDARIEAKNRGKKAVLVLSGRQCSLGVSIRNCDIVLLLNNTMSFDLIYQMMFRCMTEEEGKRCGFVVDLNIHRVIDKSIVDYALLIKPELHPREAIKYILQERIVNLNSDHWMECFMNSEDKIDVMCQNIYEIYSSNFENLSSILDKFKSFEILLSKDDQKIFNSLFSVKTPTKKQKEQIEDLMSEENIKKGIEKIGDDEKNDDKKVNEEAKVNYMDILRHIIPLVCILSIHSTESSFMDMFKIIKGDRYMYNIFLEQTKSWWGQNVNSDVMKKVKNIYKRSLSSNKEISQLIRVVKELFVKNIGNSRKLSEHIDKYLIPQELEKKTNAEISTPYKLRQEMLDKIPSEFWSSPKKVFEPCSGKGGFVIDIVHRFMEGMKETIVDEKERYKIIVEECLYFSDINPTNIFICKLLLDPYSEYSLKYNEGDTLELDIREKWDIEGFDAVIGNPPYSTNPSNPDNKPIYNKFIEKYIDNCVLMLFVVPSRWFVGGKGLDKFREFMMRRRDIAMIEHENISRKWFENVDIEGGVNYFLKDAMYEGDCAFNGMSYNLSKYDCIVDTRYHEIIDIVDEQGNLDVLYAGRYFNIETNDKCFDDKGLVKCYVSLKQSKDRCRYVNYDFNGKDKFWKVVTARANGKSPCFGIKFVAGPEEIYSGSYISFRVDDENKANSLLSYLGTKFANYMLSIRKISQDISKNTCKWIPLVPLDRTWTDNDVYEYFNFTQEQIDLIEK